MTLKYIVDLPRNAQKVHIMHTYFHCGPWTDQHDDRYWNWAGSTISNCSNLRIWVKNAKIILPFVAKFLILKLDDLKQVEMLYIYTNFCLLMVFIKKICFKFLSILLIPFWLFYENHNKSLSIIKQISNNSSPWHYILKIIDKIMKKSPNMLPIDFHFAKGNFWCVKILSLMGNLKMLIKTRRL